MTAAQDGGGTSGGGVRDDPHFLQVVGDGMAPTLRPGDLVAVAPVAAWRGEGIYLLDTGGGPELFRCESDLAGRIVIRRDNPAYLSAAVSAERFAESVRGQVCALVHVIEPTLLAGAHCAAADRRLAATRARVPA